ncbi:MAG: chorismate synthase [Alloprevotella sp.]|nr:chorismate synthase [Alloprevotella sp.]
MNTFGNILRLTSFGESHGAALGGVIDGMPAGISVDMELLHAELQRRRPGQSRLTTSRTEPDEAEILSGVFEGKTTGAPIAFIVRNHNQRSADYDALRDVFRPSHADYTYTMKYGLRDHRGGGRSSARETLVRVAAGAFAKMALRKYGISIKAFTSRVGSVALPHDYTSYDLSVSELNMVRCPDEATAAKMQSLIEEAKAQGDTIGGIVSCVVSGCPAGLGEPVFGKLHAALASAMMSINAAKGFEYGSGFEGACGYGSEQNDSFVRTANGEIRTATNRSGGIQGGISNGEDIYFNVAFKPAPTLLRKQNTVTSNGEPTEFCAHGRHDPCVLPRAVPVVEAMAALTILDFFLLQESYK